MKRVIDIPKDIFINITRMGLLRIPEEQIKIVDSAIQHSTPFENIETAKQKDTISHA